MQKLPLPNLHDAAVESFTLTKDATRLIVSVSKYEIDKEPAIHIELIFSGITHVERVMEFDQRIRNIIQKEHRDRLGYRMDSFNYCDLPPDGEGLSLALDIDHLGRLHIHCKKLSIHDV